VLLLLVYTATLTVCVEMPTLINECPVQVIIEERQGERGRMGGGEWERMGEKVGEGERGCGRETEGERERLRERLRETERRLLIQSIF